MLSTDKIIYETPVYKIGKTDWKIIVYERDNCYSFSRDGYFEKDKTYPSQRFTRYMYDAGWDGIRVWTDETNHPKYNGNDGSYAGLPKGLRKIKEKHEVEIKQALGK